MSNKEFNSRPFAKLRKDLAKAQTAVAPPPPPRPKKESPVSDAELFSREMNDVREIAEYSNLACLPRRRNTAAAPDGIDPEHEAITALAEIADGKRPLNLQDTQEYVEWVHPRHHTEVVPDLHAGRFAVQAFLDLHGLTVAEAEDELDRYLGDCRAKGLRCVKIIHGRGLRSVKGPKIKEAVVKRLSGHHRKDLIAFVSARQCDGGLGALYVLLTPHTVRRSA